MENKNEIEAIETIEAEAESEAVCSFCGKSFIPETLIDSFCKECLEESDDELDELDGFF